MRITHYFTYVQTALSNYLELNDFLYTFCIVLCSSHYYQDKKQKPGELQHHCCCMIHDFQGWKLGSYLCALTCFHSGA